MIQREYIGDVFVVVEIDIETSAEKIADVIENVYTSQYAADEIAWDKNQAAQKAGIPQRWAVICRKLYSM